MVLRFFQKEQYEANLDMEYVSTLADNLESLDKLEIRISHVRCNGCENHCLLPLINLVMVQNIFRKSL